MRKSWLAETADVQERGDALRRAAWPEFESGRTEVAEQLLHDAIALARSSGDRSAEARALGNLAGLCLATGRIEEAERLYRLGLGILGTTGNKRIEGIHLCGLSRTLLARARPDEARDAWNRGLALLRDLGDATQLERETSGMRSACAAAGVPPFDAGPA